MSNITIRPYKERDAEAAKATFADGFQEQYFLPDATLLPALGEHDLREFLTASTWAAVAELDGKPVGIIGARVPGQSKLPGRLGNTLRKWAAMARLTLGALRQPSTLATSITGERSYRRLQRNARARNQQLNNELTIFAVDAAARGTGIGSQLFHKAQEYFRRHGCHEFFLYTDSLCTYQFYERKGLRRVTQDTQRFTVHGEKREVTNFVYVCDLPAA